MIGDRSRATTRAHVMIVRLGRAALLLAVAAVTLGVGALGAQPPGGGRPGAAKRPAMEQLALLVQQRLGLTDSQATLLRQSTQRFATQREQLMRDERSARRRLREQVSARESADQRAVGALLDTLLVLQRRRVELVAAEQRELARFLTPVQRAEFLAMQERAFRAAQQARMRREMRLRGESAGGWRPPPAESGGRPPR